MLPDRPPYALAILTQSAAAEEQRSKVVAEISAAVHEHLTA
jgi:phenylpyruvate tautomerase PptA (4-oxalocrotonate tautomerase family)